MQAMAFVGRENELQACLDQAAELANGRGRFLLIGGEPGIGKTALAEEFVYQVQSRWDDVLFHKAACMEQFDHGHPYLVFADLALDIFTEQGRLKASRFYRGVLDDTAGAWLQVVPVMGPLVAAVYETARSAVRHQHGGPGGGRADGTADVLKSFSATFRRMASERPVLLFLDDLHWADPSSVTLLGYLARQLSDVPLLLVGTWRLADAACSNQPLVDLLRELRRYGRVQQVDLAGMDQDEIRRLLAEGPGAAPEDRQDPELAEEIRNRSGGNPLFALGLRGLIRNQQEVDFRSLPATIEGVYERRIHLLEDDLRTALRFASVEGDEFTSIVLARLLDEDPIDLEERLEDLQTVHGLIVEEGEERLPNREETCRYHFAHGLFQRRLYSELRRGRRRKLHRLFAEALEEMYPTPEARGPIRHKLLYHWEQAGDADQAWGYAWAEAKRMDDLYMEVEALDVLRRCAGLLDTAGIGAVDVRRADVALLRCATCQHLEQRAEAERWLEEARRLVNGVGGAEQGARLLLAEAWHAEIEDPTRASALREQAVGVARKGQPETLLDAMGAVLADRLNSEPPPWIDEYLESLDAHGTPGQLVEGLSLLGFLHCLNGREEAAAAAFGRAQAAATDSGSQELLAMTYFSRGFGEFFAGRFESCSSALVRSLELAPSARDGRAVAGFLAMVQGVIGNLPRALDLYREVLASTPRWNRPERIGAHCDVASILVDLGRFGEARQELDHARELVEAAGNEALASPILAVEAEMLVQEDDPRGALDVLLRSQALATRWGARDLLVSVSA